MNKKLFVVLLLSFMVYYSYINRGEIIQRTLYMTDFVKMFFVDIINPLKKFYLNLTTDDIEDLKLKNEKLTIIATSVLSDSNELRNSLALPKLTLKLDVVNVISRTDFSDINSLWIKYPDFNSSKIYGLIHNSYAAGVVIDSNKRPKALLNYHNKCSYSVSIGKESIPGVLNGGKGKYLIVDYIPQWLNIKENDEVVTSGLDSIFPKGIKVGIVKKINILSGYKQALIEPYNKINQSKYYYLVDTNSK
jgi:rod shape-determining protein MreC